MPGPSPFIFDAPLPPAEVIGRDGEAQAIRAWAREGRFMSLYAPRRYGKTSLLGKVALEAWEQEGMPVVLVDLYGLASISDLVVRLERAYDHHAKGAFRRRVEQVLRNTRLGFSFAGAGISPSFAEHPGLDPLPALHAVLDVPLAIAGKVQTRVLVVFDEFQALMRVEGAEAVIWSHVQHQREVASYVFAGSEVSLLRAVFGDRARPFYEQAEPFRLGLLDSATLAGAIEERFAASGKDVGGVVDRIYELTEGHPQRSMLLAHCLWVATPVGGTAEDDAWDEAVSDVRHRVEEESARYWDRLAANRQRALRALAQGISPWSNEARSTLGLPKSSATEAVKALLYGGDLEQVGDRYRFVDPLLADWARRRFGTTG
ncbi:MAG: AAA family ATPase [Acidimicrobiales bacterium]